MKRDRSGRSGQSMIESTFVIVIVCLILFGVFQISQLYAAKAVLQYAAGSAARARMVGFNDFMVYKVARAASIPNAGRMTTPSSPGSGAMANLVRTWTPGRLWSMAQRAGEPYSPQYALENSRIPSYLEAERWSYLAGILDYENWDDIHYVEGAGTDELLTARVRQNYELTWPFVRSFYAGDRVAIDSGGDEAYVVREKHYPLYLDAP